MARSSVARLGLARASSLWPRHVSHLSWARPGHPGAVTTASAASSPTLPDPRAERRRRLAEPDLEFRAFCARKGLPASSTPQLERAWQAGRYRRGEISQRPASPATRSSRANAHPVPQRTPGLFRKLDAVAVLTAPLLPVPLEYSIVSLTCAVTSRLVGLPGAAQDRLPASSPAPQPRCPGVRAGLGEGC